MKIIKIKEHFGAYILEDVKKFNYNRREELIDYIHRYKVLLFKCQSISPKEFIDFCEILGECWTNDEGILKDNGEKNFKFENFNKITKVSNSKIGGIKTGVLGNSNIRWHSDVSHRPWNLEGGTLPFRALYGHTINDNCAPTFWMDQEWLYNILTDEEQHLFENNLGIFKAPYFTPWEKDIRKMVLQDPLENKKALNVDEVFLCNINNFDIHVFEKIRKSIILRGENSENIIEQKWEHGDIVLYNNYNTSHKRLGFDDTQERTLLRTTFQIKELMPLKFV